MEVILDGVARDTRGKNEARRLRKVGQVPATVYGGELQGAQSIAVNPKELLKILRSESGVNTLIELKVDGKGSGRVLVKEFQVDPINSDLLHVDFFRLAMDKAITVTVPITLSGEAAGVKQQEGLLDFVTRDVQIECMPAEIPEHIEVDVQELLIGDGVRLGDLVKDVRWTPVSDPDTLLVHVIPPKVEEEEETDEAAAEGAETPEGEGGEPEVAKKGASEGGDQAKD